MAERERRRGGLVGPVVMVALGLVLLLNNLGVLDWNIWAVLLRMWPVLLIAAGIDLLIGRRSTLGSLLALVLIVAVIGLGVWFAVESTDAFDAREVAEITQELEDAARAEIVLAPAAAGLHVEALEDDLLLEGTVRLQSGERLEPELAVGPEEIRYELRSEGFWFFPRVGWGDEAWTWDLALNGAIPIFLEVDSGVGETYLDLTGLELDGLDVEMAVGEVTVELPPEGRFTGKIDGAIGEIILIVPEDVGLRLEGGVGLGNTEVPEGYERENGDYVSPNYRRADARVDLDVDLAIGAIRVVEQ